MIWKNYFLDIENKLNKFSGKKYSLKVIEKMLDEIEKIATSKNYEFINAKVNEKIIKDNILILISIF